MRRQWSVLATHADFRRLFTGNSVSLLGSSVTTVALPLTAVVYLHASPAQMGVLGAVAFLPHLVLGLPAGVWVDRFPYRRLLVLSDLLQMLLVGAVPVLASVHQLRIWQLYAVVLLAGVCSLFAAIAAQSFTPVLVPHQQLLQANSALALSNSTVSTTGTALGGALVQLLTAPVAIAVDAASFLLSAVCVARIRAGGQALSAADHSPPRLGRGILEGLRVVVSHPAVRAVTISATVGAFAGQMQGVIVVLFFVRDLQLPAALVGAVIAVSGVAGIMGAMVGVPLTERIGPGPAFIAGTFLAAVAGLVMAAAGGPLYAVLLVVVLAQLLRGWGPSLYGINQQTFRQIFVPPELLSRAQATWRFLVYGMQPVGALLGGLLATAAGFRATLVISSAGMLASTVLAVLSPLRSLRALPEQPPELMENPRAA
ncbi:MAG TPA: MFS transporter [Mycobacteriales bacterium]|nr:MFS transporter [Mycobacteriales bacterium]